MAVLARYPCMAKTLLYLTLCVSSLYQHGRIPPVGASDTGEDAYKYNPAEFVTSYRSLRNELVEASADDTECNESTNECSMEGVKNKRKVVGRKLVAAAVQMRSSSDSPNNKNDAKSFFERATSAVERAVVEHNATLVLLQELFLGPYFCQSQDERLFALAEITDENPFLIAMRDLAKRLQVVLPISMFERKNNAYYNSVVMIDADGSILGTYRKSHIPDGTGYQEKFYFTPGDTGFRVFQTAVGNVGVGICWDQWFPEAARAMALQGADVLLYPTAIGSEPQDPTLNSADHWQRVMQGHAASNMVPVVASNRVGTEILLNEDGIEKQRITFYGRSFITDETGGIVAEASENDAVDIISYEIDSEKNRAVRVAWGLFRDRRPELYGILQTKDGVTKL